MFYLLVKTSRILAELMGTELPTVGKHSLKNLVWLLSSSHVWEPVSRSQCCWSAQCQQPQCMVWVLPCFGNSHGCSLE